MKHSHRASALAVLGVVAAIGLAGCGSADKTTGGSAASTQTAVVKAIIAPTVDVAPLYLGTEQGIFAKHGIELKISLSPTPGGRVPALISGAADVGFIGTADVIQAVSAGVPLKFIGLTTVTTTDPAKDTGKVYVAADSAIKTPADLNGKTVAVGALKGGGELSLRAALDKTGADSKSMKFVELPLDSMYPALKSGRVDAISEIAPFTNVVEKQGARYLLSPGAEATANAVQTGVIANQSYLDKNGAVAKRLLEALTEAVDYAAKNPDEVRRILPTYSKTPKDLAAEMTLPVYTSDLTVDRLDVWVKLMTDYKFISTPVQAKSMMWAP